MAKENKTYYRIRGVVEQLGIPAHTLRFWEDEFPMFNPDRTDKGQRRYTPEQVELARRIKELLYDKGLKIDAAIKVLNGSYRKYPPRRVPQCKSAADALKHLKAVKDTLDDAHAVARLEAVEDWIKKGDTVKASPYLHLFGNKLARMFLRANEDSHALCSQ